MNSFCRKILETKYFKYTSVFFIFISILMLIVASSLDFIDEHRYFWYTEYFIGALFVIEYIIRLFGSEKPQKTFFKPLMLVDLIVIVSFFCYLNFAHLRFIRVLKTFNLFRSNKYKLAFYVILRVLKIEKEQIALVGVFFCMLLFISSTILFLIEGSLQDGFSSISKAMWWAVITATSVGYGDVIPQTALGKIVAGSTALFGVLLYSMMTAIFATGFSRELKKSKKKSKKI